jgi:hypothetical protein
MKLSIHQKLNYLGCCGMILLGIILYEINYSNQLFIGFAIGFGYMGILHYIYLADSKIVLIKKVK